MTLEKFHDIIKSAIGRGSSVDAQIPGWAAEAANLIELAYSWQYMASTESIPLVLGQNWVSVSPLIKSFNGAVRIVGTSGYREALRRIDAGDITIVDEAIPMGFYYEGDKLTFDSYISATSGESYSILLRTFKYSDWPENTSETPKLLVRGLSLLKAQTLLLAAEELRDPRMTETFERRKTEAFQAMMLAEEEGKSTGFEHEAMRYVR